MIEGVFITKNEEETKALAAKMAEEVRDGGVLALYGELGAGKTAFTKGLAKALGVKERVISPTFIIVRRHELKDGKNSKIRSFYHIDLYRITSPQDTIGLGLSEILDEKEAVVVIEWAEKLGSLLPAQRIDIRFEHLSQNARKITVKKPA